MGRKAGAHGGFQTTFGRYGYGGGLWLQVRSAQQRSWLFRYKQGGRTRDMGLGRLQDVSYAQARNAAGEWAKVLQDGRDPIDERKALKQSKAAGATSAATSFKTVADQYIESFEGGWHNAKHRQQWRNTLATYAAPKIGNKLVADITKKDVYDVLNPIWKTKTETASRVRQRIERVVGFAIAQGWRTEANPARWRDGLNAMLPPPGKVRKPKHYPAMPYPEMPVFMAQLRTVAGISAQALQLQILTATRSGSVRAAQRKEFDLAQNRWSIPEPHMKGDQPFEVPLSWQAVSLLRKLRLDALNPEDLVFPGSKPGEPLSDNSMTMLMRRMCAEDRRPPGVVFRDLKTGEIPVPHGFRSSIDDWASDTTWYPRQIIDAALAHVAGDTVTRAYRRGDAYEFRAALMQEWADYCCGRDAADAAEDGPSPGKQYELPKSVRFPTERDIEAHATPLVNLLMLRDDPGSRSALEALQRLMGRPTLKDLADRTGLSSLKRQ